MSRLKIRQYANRFFLLVTIPLLLTQTVHAESRQETDLAPLIFGGETVQPGDPLARHVVAIVSQGHFKCTAFLISAELALTAAHCIAPAMSLSFGLEVGSNRSITRRVTSHVSHENYDLRREVDSYDIALLRFAGGLPVGYRPLHITSGRNGFSPGAQVMLIGYGINGHTRWGSGSGVLRKTTVRVQNPRFGSTELSVDQSRGSGACHGDSGGPLIAEVGGRIFAFGIANRYHASTCASELIYADIGIHAQWIMTKSRTLSHLPPVRTGEISYTTHSPF